MGSSSSSSTAATRASLSQQRHQQQQQLATDLAAATHEDLEADEVEDNVPLFWQPGKRGFYSPRIPAKGGAHHPSTERLNAYRNVGRIVGLCLLQNEMCPLFLNRHVLKHILGRRIGWHDLAFFDPVTYESMRRLVVDVETQPTPRDAAALLASLDLTFCAELCEEEGGELIQLVNGGTELEVTPSNVYEYVRRYARHRMVTVAKQPLDNFREGEFDVQALINYTSFNDESKDMSGDRVVKFKRWFWSVVERMSNMERQDLVYFWTSSPALPASEEGFQPMPTITIRPADDAHLPTANTCISRLYIPLYSSKQILRTKLLLAIKTKNFGFV